MGPQNLLIAFHDDPELVMSLFAISNQYNLEAGRRQADAGVDALFIFDDIGYKTAPFISLDHYHRLVLPFIQVLIDGLRKTGGEKSSSTATARFTLSSRTWWMPASLVSTLCRELQESTQASQRGIRGQGLHCGERRFVRDLPYGSVKDVEQEVKECIRIAGPGGGYVLASDHSLHDGIPVENIRAMVRSGREWGSYPLAVG